MKKMRFGRRQSPDGRLKALARKIEAVAQKDLEQVRLAQEAARVRGRAVAELHAVCRELVEAINGLLAEVHSTGNDRLPRCNEK